MLLFSLDGSIGAAVEMAIARFQGDAIRSHTKGYLSSSTSLRMQCSDVTVESVSADRRNRLLIPDPHPLFPSYNAWLCF